MGEWWRRSVLERACLPSAMPVPVAWQPTGRPAGGPARPPATAAAAPAGSAGAAVASSSSSSSATVVPVDVAAVHVCDHGRYVLTQVNNVVHVRRLAVGVASPSSSPHHHGGVAAVHQQHHAHHHHHHHQGAAIAGSVDPVLRRVSQLFLHPGVLAERAEAVGTTPPLHGRPMQSFAHPSLPVCALSLGAYCTLFHVVTGEPLWSNL